MRLPSISKGLLPAHPAGEAPDLTEGPAEGAPVHPAPQDGERPDPPVQEVQLHLLVQEAQPDPQDGQAGEHLEVQGEMAALHDDPVAWPGAICLHG